jgi:hypothetical protein
VAEDGTEKEEDEEVDENEKGSESGLPDIVRKATAKHAPKNSARRREKLKRGKNLYFLRRGFMNKALLRS